MNEESLRRANAFLAAVAERVPAGEWLAETPADIGREVGLPDALSSARAVRALMARRRIEQVDGRYRLLDPRPVDPGEPESVPRAPRRRRSASASGERRPSDGRPTYSEVGREIVERLLELGREVGTLRGGLRDAREDARRQREARDEAERRAGELSARVRELEARVEMAEGNLRTVLAAARGSVREGAVGDTEMEAILGVLKGDEAGGDGGERA